MGNPSRGIVGRVSAGRVSLASRPQRGQVRGCNFSDEQADCGRVPPRGTSLRPHFFATKITTLSMQQAPKLRGVDIMTPEQAAKLHRAMIRCFFREPGTQEPCRRSRVFSLFWTAGCLGMGWGWVCLGASRINLLSGSTRTWNSHLSELQGGPLVLPLMDQIKQHPGLH